MCSDPQIPGFHGFRGFQDSGVSRDIAFGLISSEVTSILGLRNNPIFLDIPMYITLGAYLPESYIHSGKWYLLIWGADLSGGAQIHGFGSIWGVPIRGSSDPWVWGSWDHAIWGVMDLGTQYPIPFP